METKLSLVIAESYIYPGYYRKRNAVYDVNELKLELVNNTGGALTVEADEAPVLELSLGDGAADLVLDGAESELEVTVGRMDLRAVELEAADGYVRYVILPNEGDEIVLAAKERVKVLITKLKSPVPEDEQPKMAHIRLAFEEMTTYYPVYKRVKREVVKFILTGLTADGQGTYSVGYGDLVTIEWETRGFEACVLYPYRWTNWEKEAWRTEAAVLPAAGALTMPVYADMKVTLRAVRLGEPDQWAAIQLKVAGGEKIDSFTVKPPRSEQPVKAGSKIEFAAVCENTRHAYVDRGIGRINLDGKVSGKWTNSWSFTPQTNLKVYNLTVCQSGALERKSMKAGVKDALELVDFWYRADQINDKWKYYVRWRVANSDGSVKLTTSDGTVRSQGKEEGTMDFSSQGKEPFLKLCIEAKQKAELGCQTLYWADLQPKLL